MAKWNYRDASGRFISQVKARALGLLPPQARGAAKIAKRAARTGRRRGPNRRQRVENFFRAKLGAPPSGMNWFNIASQYPDRFQDYIAEMDE